jgi:hypothetical protein
VWTHNKKRRRRAGQRHYGMNCTSYITNKQNIFKAQINDHSHI